MVRDMLLHQKAFNCGILVIFVQTLTELGMIFSMTNGRRKFFPFTNILVVLILKERPSSGFKFDGVILKLFTTYSLKVVLTLYDSFVVDGLQMKRAEFSRTLSNETFTVEQHIGKFFNKDHFISTLLKNDFGLMEIRASFFNCPPMIVYLTKENQTKYDGVEYRCLDEVTKYPRPVGEDSK